MQSIKDGIQIVYASDDRFAQVLGVSIASVFRAGADAGCIGITVIDGGISPKNRQNLDKICREYGSKSPNYIQQDDLKELLGDHIQTDRGSIMQYARLLIGRLPYDRILYLDCDVMVRKPIADLWNTDLQGMTAAAMPDVFSRFYRKGMELKPEDPIYNDGVMLVDLTKWREHQIEEKSLAFIHRHHGSPLKNDLGAINAVLRGEVRELSPAWNAVTAFYDFSYEEMLYYRKPPKYFAKEQIERAASDPCAVHFTSSFCSSRPWEAGCRHPYAAEYTAIRETTPWADEPLAQPKRGLLNRLANRLPWALTIRIAPCLQAYARPLYCRFREGVRNIGR